MKCGHPDCEWETTADANFGAAMAERRAHHRDEHDGASAPRSSSSRAKRRRRRTRGDDPPGRVDDAPPAPSPDVAAAFGEVRDGHADERPPAVPVELAPAPARRTWRDRLWGGRRDAPPPSSEPAAPTTREKRPRRTGKRNTTAPLFSMAWGGVGTVLARSGVDAPVGRCMQLQSAAAGDILDKVTRDTIVDRVLQPLAGKVDEAEAFAALLALPMLVGVVERAPDLAGPLEPMLRAAVRAHLVAMVPVMKRQQAEEKKFAEALAELGMSEANGDDPVGAMLDAMFGPPPDEPPAPPAAPDTSANGAAEYYGPGVPIA